MTRAAQNVSLDLRKGQGDSCELKYRFRAAQFRYIGTEELPDSVHPQLSELDNQFTCRFWRLLSLATIIHPASPQYYRHLHIPGTERSKSMSVDFSGTACHLEMEMYR